MRIKKGFTLAEILIVLMVIGVIATMTIPSLMKGVAEAQYKAGYKKAYNAIVNLAAMEKVAGQLPTKGTSLQTMAFFSSMGANLSVKEYIQQGTLYKLDTGNVVVAGSGVPGIKYDGDCGKFTLGLTSQAKSGGVCPTTTEATDWMVTDDGLAYTIIVGGESNDCNMKGELLTYTSAADTALHSCAIVVVDVNGPYKGPNRLERQQTTSGAGASAADFVNGSTTKLTTLTRDQYYIYIGSDGATHGPIAYTVTGRIINDLK